MANEMRSFYTSPMPSRISPCPPQIMDGLITNYTSTLSLTGTIPTRHRPGLVKRLLDRVRLEYYRYEVTFGIYVMTPGEKFVANTFVVVFLSLLIWALLLYFPSLLYQKLSRLIWLLTGQSEDVGVVFGMLEKGFRSRASALPTSRNF